MKPNEKCPGEYVCTNDRVNGECASKGRTLAQHCHPDIDHGGCRLYYTKKGVTPIEFDGMLEAALVCRARQKAGLDLARFPLPFWAEKTYLLANSVMMQVEGEELEDDEEKAKSTQFNIKGSGDSGAFALIYQQMQEMRRKRED